MLLVCCSVILLSQFVLDEVIVLQGCYICDVDVVSVVDDVIVFLVCCRCDVMLSVCVAGYSCDKVQCTSIKTILITKAGYGDYGK